eukprot:FR737090.1.p1 GENE.FR737090.1~~FR737090.1.p1  ORF type:complete len:213 (+),score=35.36 FR737090.1:71-640(+)
MIMKLEPGFVKGYHRVANAQIELGEMDEAIKTIRLGLQKDPESKELSLLLRKIKTKKRGELERQKRGVNMNESMQKEMHELSEQYQTTGRELSECNAKLAASARSQKLTSITAGEIEEVPEDSRLYRSVGKMFMLSSKEEVKSTLTEELEDEQQKNTELASKRTYLQRRLASQEASLKDLMMSATGGQF